jgi:adenosylmethionine-8-amino-7-oxononanoate aminotransferase
MSLPEHGFEHIWFPFSYSDDLLRWPPIVIERGEGIYLYDRDGKRYVDAVGSWWVSILGHCHPSITAALREQIDSLDHVLMAGFVAPPTVRMAGLLARMLPPSLKHYFFSDDGSTAVESALKMAMQYWALKKEKRIRFIALGGAYHGDTFGAMSVGGLAAYNSPFNDYVQPALFTDPPYCYRCPCGRDPENCDVQCMNSLDILLDKHKTTVAACIVEPMLQGAAGMRVYPAKVLRRIFDLCKRSGILIIADEVATGFGRTGRRFACEHAGVVPDILCMAKGLTGGFLPMAVTAANDTVYNEFCGEFGSGRIFNHGHSFTGNPLAASAACAALSFMLDNDIPGSLSPLVEQFAEGLRRFRNFEIVGDVRSIGMVGAIEFVANRKTREPHPAHVRITHRICRAALDRGLIMRPLGNVLYFIPALTITPAQLEEMFSLCEASIEDVLSNAGNDF